MVEKNKKLALLKKEVYKNKESDGLDIDLEAVQNIVAKMKKKSSAVKGNGNLSEGHIKELRSIISEGKLAKLNIDTEAKLLNNSESQLDRKIAKFYKPFQKLVDFIVKYVLKNKFGQKIAFNLYSANIKKTPVQHMITSTIFSILISLFVTILFFVIFTFVNPLFLVTIPFIAAVVFILFLISFAYIGPLQKANQRGILIDIELPFALRHLATELQAGLGLYKTIQSIAKNDYGVLSEELSRTVLEIENGTDTKTALRHTALRSKSKNFNVALFHIIRTLNTGGNLSSSINDVADTVSFDLMESSKVFGEKMNFFGIIFIFAGIVLPVFVAILGAIANAPISQDGSAFLPGVMSPGLLSVIYLVIMPMVFVFLVYYIKMIEPKT